MRKLNKKKVRWIIREMEKGEQSVRKIAKSQKITARWARELYKRYVESGEYPYPRKVGRKKRGMDDGEIKKVIEVKEKHVLAGANVIEKMLSKEGERVAHNRIHRILKESGYVKEEPKKQRRRKWVRYERKHSLSLYHMDWFEDVEEGMQILLIEDDASRFISGWGIFENATASNSVLVLKESIERYGKPKQVMTDHGTQFTSLPREGCETPEPNEFQKVLAQYDIKHIKATVKHPQSNGKVERLGHTLFQLRDAYGSWIAAVNYYNFERPHWSLNIDDCETPFQAFVRKMHPSKRTKFINAQRSLIEKYAPQFLNTSKKDSKEVVST